VYPVNHIEHASPSMSSPSRGARTAQASAMRHVRARVCLISLLVGDLLAFVVAALIACAISGAQELPVYARAMENLTTLGSQWHGWGTALVLVCLLSYFGGRGHYTSRVPSWTQLGDVVIACAVALACDIFLTIAIYHQPVDVEALFRWILFCPSLLLLRVGTRGALQMAGMWSLQTLIVASPDEVEAAGAALSSDASLGYRVVGTITPDVAAALSDAELPEMVADRHADFLVVAVGGGDPGRAGGTRRAPPHRIADRAGADPAWRAGHWLPPALLPGS